MSQPEHVIWGDPDLYGTGVRVGLYAQWVATLFATVFDPSSESDLRLANLIIQCAVFLGLCVNSANDKPLVGAMITQFLLCGSLSSVTGDGIGHLSRFSGVMRVFFYLGLSAYGCWFWFEGIDIMQHNEHGVHDIAFLGGTQFDGWFRTLGKVASVGGVIICVGCLCYSVYAIFQRFRDGFQEAFAARHKGRPRVELSLMVLSMGLIAISIATVEYLVSVNNVRFPTNDKGNIIMSVGQFIPLIAGGVVCLFMVWKVIMDGLFMRKRCWFLFGYHL